VCVKCTVHSAGLDCYLIVFNVQCAVQGETVILLFTLYITQCRVRLLFLFVQCIIYSAG